MTVVQLIFRDDEFVVGVEYNEIGIVAGGKPTLATRRNQPVEPAPPTSIAPDRAM